VQQEVFHCRISQGSSLQSAQSAAEQVIDLGLLNPKFKTQLQVETVWT